MQILITFGALAVLVKGGVVSQISDGQPQAPVETAPAASVYHTTIVVETCTASVASEATPATTAYPKPESTSVNIPPVMISSATQSTAIIAPVSSASESASIVAPITSSAAAVVPTSSASVVEMTTSVTPTIMGPVGTASGSASVSPTALTTINSMSPMASESSVSVGSFQSTTAPVATGGASNARIGTFAVFVGLMGLITV